MKKSTIGIRLTGALVAVILAVVVLGGVSLKLNSDLGSQLERTVKVIAKEQVLAGTVSSAAADLTAAERGVAFSTVLQQHDRVGSFKSQFTRTLNTAQSALRELRPLQLDGATRKAVEDLEKQAEDLGRQHQEMVRMLEAQQMDMALKFFDESMVPRLTAMSEISKRLVSEAGRELASVDSQAAAATSRSRWISILLMIVCVGVTVAAAYMTRSVTSQLRLLTARMAASARAVHDASGQISSASASLAQGAARQASSLEETSSSGQEMSSMTQRNAENARSMNGLMSEVDHRVTEANRSLEGMLASMTEINASSQKIARIMKVIDEISFQTNILALNAAVEAARAGEAGMGFAVVADEVRNLAQRCAEAARDTSGLIEESIRSSNDGSSKLNNMAEAIRSITDSTHEVKRLADEVNLGSQEQARGIDHIASTLSQMEQVTQEVAASAEESAAAASSMSSEAVTLNQVVGELVEMVGRSS